MQTNTLISSSSSFVFIAIIITIAVLFFTTNVFGNNPPTETPATTTATTLATTLATTSMASEPTYVCSGPDGAYILNHGNTLFKGNALEECHGIVSTDGKSQLVVEDTGKVVMYKNKEVVWSITGSGGTPYKLALDDSGNLVLTSAGSSKWSSETADKGVSNIVLENSGHLVFYKDTREIVKTIPELTECVGPEATYIPRLDHLVPEQVLNKCEALISKDKTVILAMQSDGMLKIYNTTDNREIWSTPAPRPGDPIAANLVIQKDGNAVIYNNEAPIWASNTPNRVILKEIRIQDDGNLVMYDTNNVPVWSSRTRK